MGSRSSREPQVPQPAQVMSLVPEPRTSEPPQPAVSTVPEKCYDLSDPTLRFVDGEDELDFEYTGYKSRRAVMSCGHAVTPMSLTKYCRWLLEEGRKSFTCPVDYCDARWSFSEVCKMALLTPEERKQFQTKLAQLVNEFEVTKLCPGCKCPVERVDYSNLCIHCPACYQRDQRRFVFCWQCLREWRGPFPRSDRCENKGCTNQDLQVLKKCKNIEFQSVDGVTDCPSVRACPTCGLLLMHDSTMCKNVLCPRCDDEFCFVCLKLTDDCLDLRMNEYSSCASRVAPRQKTIPVWERRGSSHTP